MLTEHREAEQEVLLDVIYGIVADYIYICQKYNIDFLDTNIKTGVFFNELLEMQIKARKNTTNSFVDNEKEFIKEAKRNLVRLEVFHEL